MSQENKDLDVPPLRVRDLNTAAELTTGNRNIDYGEPVDNYRRTAEIAGALLRKSFTPHEAAMFMVAVKLARLDTSPTKDDNYIDAMAYLGIAHECAEWEKQEKFADATWITRQRELESR